MKSVLDLQEIIKFQIDETLKHLVYLRCLFFN